MDGRPLIHTNELIKSFLTEKVLLPDGSGENETQMPSITVACA